jgi:hypothetical protein
MLEAAYHKNTEEFFISIEGGQAVREAVAQIFRRYCEQAMQFANPSLGWQPVTGLDQQQAVARLGYDSVQLLYQAPYTNRVGTLRIRQFNGGLAAPGRREMNAIEIQELGSTNLSPTRTPTLGVCWHKAGTKDPMTVDQVADLAVHELVSLAQRLERERH